MTCAAAAAQKLPLYRYLGGPMARVMPGWTTVDAVRDSWQPPQKRDSPGPPENHTGPWTIGRP